MRSWVERLLAATLGLLLVCAALEIGLRALGAGFAWRQASLDHPAPAAPAPRLPGGDLTVLCIGESTTAMGGPEAWPRQLERLLAERLPDRRVAVINRGFPGVDTSVLLARLPRQLDEFAPAFVVAMIGANDGYAAAIPRADTPMAERGWVARLRIAQLVRQIATVRDAPWDAAAGGQVVPRWNIVEGPHAAPGSAGSLCDRWTVRRARSETRAGDVAAAAHRLERAVAARPGSALLQEELGVVLLGLGALDEADAALARAAALDPTAASVHVEMAHVDELRTQIRDLDQAVPREAPADVVRHLRRALELDPDHVEALNHLAAALQGLDPPAVEALLRRSIERGSGADNMAVSRLQGLLRSQGRIAEAEAIAARFPAPAVAGPGGRPQAASSATCPLTRASYRRIQDEVAAHGARLVAVQYPRQPVDLMRGMLDPGTLVVDNDAIFDWGVGEWGFSALFEDACYQEFGHATPAGNRLLAERVAEVVLGALPAGG